MGDEIRMKGTADHSSRRTLLSTIGTAVVVSTAGCVSGGGTSEVDPTVRPEIDFSFGQTKGVFERTIDSTEWRTITVEIYHDGGDAADPSTLDVDVVSNAGTDEHPDVEATLADHSVYSWDQVVGEERNFENVNGVFEEGDIVAVRGQDHNRPNSTQGMPRDGDLIRVQWRAPDGEDEEVIGQYEVQGCLEGQALDPESGQCQPEEEVD